MKTTNKSPVSEEIPTPPADSYYYENRAVMIIINMKAVTVGRKNPGWENFLTKLPLQKINKAIPYRINVRDGFSGSIGGTVHVINAE
jgi:hypothetical protein